jgi:hypothetical protein
MLILHIYVKIFRKIAKEFFNFAGEYLLTVWTNKQKTTFPRRERGRNQK